MVDQETIDKINAAINAALNTALKDVPKPATTAAPVTAIPEASPKQPVTPSSVEKHTWETQEDGSVFCSHCKGKALPISIDPDKGPEELLSAMQNIYHKKSKDWLSCPECRSTFSTAMDKMGYQVELHKDGRIEIEKK
jgi:hypothetical protein